MKKLSLFVLVLAMAFPFSASSALQTGDVNGDAEVGISDVTVLINYLLTGDATGLSLDVADCDQNGEIGISDVTVLINYLLTGSWPQSPVTDENYVDLGLPSGTLWATRNVGATNPEDYGDYFAWGETEPKEYYHASTYKWNDSETSTIHLSKYNTKEANGTVDGKTVLDPEDDAARANYPNGQMPSKEQLEELIANCTWTWTQVNGVNGQLVAGPNGNTMFLPATGYRLQGKLYSAGTHGSYWLNSILAIVPLNGEKMYVASGQLIYQTSSRAAGYTVRAVRAQD